MRIVDYTYLDIPKGLIPFEVNKVSTTPNTFVIPLTNDDDLADILVYACRMYITAPYMEIWELVDDDTEDSVGLAVQLPDQHQSFGKKHIKVCSTKEPDAESYEILYSDDNFYLSTFENAASLFVLKGNTNE